MRFEFDRLLVRNGQPVLILPPQPVPKSDKGRTFQAKITVAADGRVLNVEVRPKIRDLAYRRRFEEQLYQWAFAPAVTREGVPVRGETVITIRRNRCIRPDRLKPRRPNRRTAS